MKKIIYFLVFLIIFIPNVVFADIYDVATSKAERYILSNDYVNTYERYIIPNSGELLSYNEFLLTLESEKNTPKVNAYSYLYDGTKYWTSSKLNNKYYVVNSVETLYENTNDTPKTRVVETVKSDTIVSGSGTVNNPWIFKYLYSVNLSSNDLTKGKISLSQCDNSLEEKSITLISDSNKVAYLCAKPGYKYIDNSCEDVLKASNNALSIIKLNRDMDCVVNFGIDTLEITLENDKVDNEVNPNVLYLAYSKGWYLDNAGTKSIKKLVALPEKTGYEYAGYYTEKNGLGTKVIDENGNILKGNETSFNESSKIYPYFKAISYNIVYYSNGGSGTMSPSTHIYNEEKTLTFNAFTKVGYSFDGWSTSSNGPIVYSNNQPVINLASTSGTTINLYAKWVVNRYTIKYDGNGATSGNIVNKIYNYDEVFKIEENIFVKTNYTFLGWSTTSNGSVQYNPKQEVSKLNSVQNSVVTLYAIWKANYSCPTGTLKYDETKGYICVINSSVGSSSYTCGCKQCASTSCSTCSGLSCDSCPSTTCDTCQKAYYYNCKTNNYPCNCTPTVNDCDCHTVTSDCNCSTVNLCVGGMGARPCFVRRCSKCSQTVCNKCPGQKCEVCKNTVCSTGYTSYDCNCVTTSSPCNCVPFSSPCGCVTTQYTCDCSTCYSSYNYCPSGWTNYTGSGSTLNCYQAAKLG